MIWTLIAAMALITAGMRVLPALLLGGRPLPGWAAGMVALLAPVILSALVAVTALAMGSRLVLDARAAGLAAAAIVLVIRPSPLLAAVAAASVAALIRAFA